jgi:uncharacterized protein YndB with AHSA1/START domain
MPTETIELSRILPATPERIFAAWLDAAEHAAMTGSPATVDSTEVGGRFTAWDGYIDGSHLALEPGVRILQSWRSNDFPADALDSLLEVRLEPVPEGTRVTLRHSDLPEGHGPALLEGWTEFYFVPMGRHFGKGKARGAKPVAKASGRKKAEPRKRRPSAKKLVVRKGGRTAATKAKPGRRAAKRGGAARRGAVKPGGAKKAAVRRASKRKGVRR